MNMMKRVLSLILAMMLLLGNIPVAAFATEIGAPALSNSELSATIEKQIRAFADSIDKANADDDAAWTLASHGMFKGGKKLSVGKSHALTATLLNSEMAQVALTAYCEVAMLSMQHLGLDTLVARGSLKWDGADSFYYLGARDTATKLADWNLVNTTVFDGKRNSHDEALDWMVGGADVDMTIKRSKVAVDTVTYQVTFQISDLFDFTTGSNDFFKDLISGIGELLFREFTWESKVTFNVTVPYDCSHSSGKYHWTYDAKNKTMISDTTDGWKANTTTRRTNTTTSGAVSYYYELADPVKLDHDKPWIIEFDIKNTGIFHLSPAVNVSTSRPSLTIGTRKYFTVYDYERVMLSEQERKEMGLASRSQAIHHYYGTDLSGWFTYSSKKLYAFRLENEVKANGSNMIYLSAWEADTGKVLLDHVPMDDYYKNETWVKKYVLVDENSNWISGKDLSISYIGNDTYRFAADSFDLRIWPNGENGEIISYYRDKVTKPTCTAKGYTTHTCTLCGYSYKDTYVKVLGHSYGDWTQTKAPDCVTAGQEQRTCTTCKGTETREIPAHGHSYEAAVSAPTCTGDGYTTNTCSVCGDTYQDTYVDKLGHEMGVWTVTLPATCTETGEQCKNCSRCDHFETETIKAIGHTEAIDEAVAPTCTETGLTEGKHCSVCDEVLVAQETVAATGHAFGDWEQAEKAGEESRECETCGHCETRKLAMQKLEAPKAKISGDAESGKPIVKWNTVDGVAKYRVYRSTKKTSGYELIYTGIKARSYTDKTAKAGTNYYYKVKAIHEDSALNSDWSNVVNRVCDLAQPTVTITGSSTSGKPIVKWETVAGAAKYRVYRATSKDGEYELVYTGVSARSYTDKTAEVGTTYYYKVKAIHKDSAANSAYSSVVSRLCDLAKPEVTITRKNGDPSLTWDKVDGAAKYYIYRATSKDGKYTKIKTTVSATSFTDTTAKAGTKYYYKVKAIHKNTEANSAYSSVKYITAK